MNCKKVFLITIMVACAFSSSFSQPYLPSQFISKMYTEALGRAPDPAGWNGWHDYFTTNGCNVTSLKYCAVSFFTGTEYTGLGNDSGEVVYTIFRALLSRDPEPVEYASWVSVLKTTSITAVVNAFCDSPEFASLATSSAIFNGGSYNGTVPAGTFPFSRIKSHTWNNLKTWEVQFTGTTEAQLQTLLNNPGTGKTTVVLDQKALISCNTTLIIPAKRILRTYIGNNLTVTRCNYARFARLIRSTSFSSTIPYKPLVQLGTGSKLEHIFVDGGWNWIHMAWGADNIQINSTTSDTGTRVIECHSSGVQPGTHVDILETTAHIAPPIYITNNLFTGYERSHRLNGVADNADGITCKMGNCFITGNHIVDPTDVAVPIFYVSDPLGVQNSQVTANTIVNAGNGAWACFVYNNGGFPSASPNFSGMTIQNNLIMMGRGPYIHYDFLLTSSRPWNLDPITNLTGLITFTGNTFYYPMVCNTGFLLSNVNNISISNNTINPSPQTATITQTFSVADGIMMHIYRVASTNPNYSLNSNAGFPLVTTNGNDADVAHILLRHIDH